MAGLRLRGQDVKVWRLADGTLAHTLRLPQGPGNPGKVYAVAISPDGTRIAAGGWTDPRAGTDSIYIFDRATGALAHRITGLPNVVFHLAYDADGERLAATLGGTTRTDRRSLALVHSADNASADNGSLSNVAWSADGRSLLAGGQYNLDG